jgi:hypothetical protein
MKLLSLVLAALIFCSTVTYAEHLGEGTPKEPETLAPDNKIFEDMFRLPSLIDCGPPDKIQKMVDDYGEVPIAEGNTFIIRPDLILQPGPLTLFVNPSTKTWTMVVKFKPAGYPEMWCVVGAGTEFGPAIQKTSI